ncbi:uncharacterized protein LOC143617696 isoform X2 [Bidens hawaiensis]|uniref:uncharacterized protein LOC143617696 isoform X2 n=1 Tax=Bidens hawaiensis TaxID=980011 RepID=UPI00404B99C4
MANGNPNSPIILSSDDDDDDDNPIIVEKPITMIIMPASTSSNPSSSAVTQLKQHNKKKKKETIVLPGKTCFICKKGDHHVKYCPEKSSWGTQSTKMCLNCGDVGHEMFSCKSMYSPDDLKEVQCYVCKGFGHLCCVNYADEVSTEVSCYRCGQLGHSGWECAKVHAETCSEWTPSSCCVCHRESHTACKCIGVPKVKRIKDPSIPETEEEKEKKKTKKMMKRMEKKNEMDSTGKCGNDLGAKSMPPQPNPRGSGSSITKHHHAYNHNYNHGRGYPMAVHRFQFDGGSGYSSGFYSNPGMFHAAGYNIYQHRFSASGFGNSSSYGRGKHG